MVKTHRYTGTWWLPGDDAKQLYGTLTVTRGHAELELLSNFGHKLISETEKEKVFSLWLEEPRRIVGIGASRDEITLEGRGLANPGDISSYQPPWVLVGKAFAAEEEIGFDEMVVQFTDLDTWTCVSGFSKPRIDPEQPEAGVAGMFDIRFERPPAFEIPLDGGEKAEIEFWPGHSGWRQVTTSVTISQTAALRLRFAKRHSLNQVAQRVGELRYFLCLAVGRPVSVLSVTVFQDDYRRPDSTHALPIELLWQIPHNPEPPTEPRHPFQMPFTLPEAPQGIAEVMKRWFAMQERYKPVFNLYFGMRFHPDMYGDIRFLAYAQAVETFHLRAGGADVNLDERIRALLADCPAVSAEILKAAAVELDDFVTAFKDSRNYYTHYDPKKEDKAARGVLLYVLTVQLQAILEMSMLRELGFSCDQIHTIFKTRTRRYAEIANAKAYAADEDEAVPQE